MKKVLVVILAVVFVVAMGTTAFAAGSLDGDGKASTEVSVKMDDSVDPGDLSVTVPLNITLAVGADGTVTAPTNYAISNTGAIPVKVTNIKTTPAAPFSFADGANKLALTLNTEALSATAITPGTSAWNVAGGADLNLTLAGAVSGVNVDITTAQKAFDIEYTIAAGSF